MEKQQQIKNNVVVEGVETLLCKQGIGESKARMIATEYSVQHIRQQIEWLPRRNAENPQGMLIAAIEEDWSEPPKLKQAEKAESTEREQSWKREDAQQEAVINALVQKQDAIRNVHLAEWNRLPVSKQTLYFKKTAAQMPSKLAQARLERNRDLTNPPHEVLAVMAADHTASA